ncbi:DJ-1/PfpI family protein [Novosphingobium colocasiae]
MAAQATGGRCFALGKSVCCRTDSDARQAHGGDEPRPGAGPVGGQEQIAMLLYPKFTALDLVGPHYFFACLFGAKVHLVTTEKDLSPVMSDLGLAITPTVTMADAPKDLDVLFVPGGTEGTLSVMGRTDTMAWIRDRAARAKHITSVCTGSMVLAKAGLLKGKRATSHWVARDVLADFGAIPVNERVVKDGNILTGAGVSAGLDFAIALVEQLRGRAYAEALVLQGEYAPRSLDQGRHAGHDLCACRRDDERDVRACRRHVSRHGQELIPIFQNIQHSRKVQ